MNNEINIEDFMFEVDKKINDFIADTTDIETKYPNAYAWLSNNISNNTKGISMESMLNEIEQKCGAFNSEEVKYFKNIGSRINQSSFIKNRIEEIKRHYGELLNNDYRALENNSSSDDESVNKWYVSRNQYLEALSFFLSMKNKNIALKMFSKELHEKSKMFFESSDFDVPLTSIASGVAQNMLRKELDKRNKKIKNTSSVERKNRKPVDTNSDNDYFTFVNLSKDDGDDIEKLKDFMTSLKVGKYISDDTKFSDFKKVFRLKGNERLKKGRQIVWMKNANLLGYLIKYMCGTQDPKKNENAHKIIEANTDHWSVVVNRFFYSKKNDQFVRSNFTGVKDPAGVDDIIQLKKIADTLL